MHIHIAFQGWSSRFEDHQSVNDIQCYECKLHHIWKKYRQRKESKRASCNTWVYRVPVEVLEPGKKIELQQSLR